jgi:hypothetical protein
LTFTPPSVGGYGLSAKALDAAGNAQSAPWVSFSMFDGASDDIDPDTQAGSPAGGASVPLGPVTLTGTATDNQGVTSVKVAIKDVTTNKWWTGSGWGGWARVETALADAGATSTDWSYTFTPPQTGSYTYSPQAGDAAGNVDQSPPWISFSVYDGAADSEPPDAVVVVPTPNQSFPAGPIDLAGSATDDQAVAAVELAIKDSATGQWWTGSGWGGFQYLDATLDAPGATSTGWSFSFNPSGSGGYGVLVRAQDAAGNYDPSKPWVSFSNG